MFMDVSASRLRVPAHPWMRDAGRCRKIAKGQMPRFNSDPAHSTAGGLRPLSGLAVLSVNR
jgi:hypothetical protein